MASLVASSVAEKSRLKRCHMRHGLSKSQNRGAATAMQMQSIEVSQNAGFMGLSFDIANAIVHGTHVLCYRTCGIEWRNMTHFTKRLPEKVAEAPAGVCPNAARTSVRLTMIATTPTPTLIHNNIRHTKHATGCGVRGQQLATCREIQSSVSSLQDSLTPATHLKHLLEYCLLEWCCATHCADHV